jgi:hypothetical protein
LTEVQAMLLYRRWPAPLFWLLLACSLRLFWSAARKWNGERSRIEQLVSCPAPGFGDSNASHRRWCGE